jgi:hypothetical protein
MNQRIFSSLKHVENVGKHFGLLLLLTSFQPAWALEWGCNLRPAMIPEVGSRLIRQYNERNLSFPNHVNLRTNVKVGFRSRGGVAEKSVTSGTVEGFYRPAQNADYSYFALPIFNFQLNRDHDVVYLCAHDDPDPKKSHVTLYILQGYRLEPLDFTSQWQDLFNKAQMRAGSVKVKAIGMGMMDELNPFPLLDSIPLLSQIKDIPTQILESLNRAIGEFVALPMGAQIERVVLTSDYIELDTDVDLLHPEQARVFFRFDFKDGANGP